MVILLEIDACRQTLGKKLIPLSISLYNESQASKNGWLGFYVISTLASQFPFIYIYIYIYIYYYYYYYYYY